MVFVAGCCQWCMHTSRVGCDCNGTYRTVPPCQCMHTSRVGCDYSLRLILCTCFYSVCTHPVWDVTVFVSTVCGKAKSVCTHPVWDVTRSKDIICDPLSRVCTHPVWDVTTFSRIYQDESYVYAHIPCGM